MHIILAVVCLASVTLAADVSVNHLGESYNFNYDTGTGQTRSESGSGDNVAGSYSYIDANGDKRTVHYTADKDGFHPTGDISVDKKTAEAAEALAALAPKAPEEPAPVAPVVHHHLPWAYYGHPWMYHGHLGHAYVNVHPTGHSYSAYW